MLQTHTLDLTGNLSLKPGGIFRLFYFASHFEIKNHKTPTTKLNCYLDTFASLQDRNVCINNYICSILIYIFQQNIICWRRKGYVVVAGSMRPYTFMLIAMYLKSFPSGGAAVVICTYKRVLSKTPNDPRPPLAHRPPTSLDVHTPCTSNSKHP